MQPVPPPLGEGSGGIPHVDCQPTGGHVTRSSGSDKRCQDTTLGAVRLGLGSKLGEEREETGTGTAEGRTEYKGCAAAIHAYDNEYCSNMLQVKFVIKLYELA
ncbi:hypothetical protein PSTT_12427 [Puccinia striiformis]|uniref:Uncharacterized protein n=1 Tax=Puccinia striiformis TaxID=27350 RepID=A0A2S4UWA0_9BASI|nr:hypothetical protein PSTT_12427 [Puccinia striiformis]